MINGIGELENNISEINAAKYALQHAECLGCVNKVIA
jgi:hypothetical protein